MSLLNHHKNKLKLTTKKALKAVLLHLEPHAKKGLEKSLQLTIEIVIYALDKSVQEARKISKNEALRKKVNRFSTKLFYKRLARHDVAIGSVLKCVNTFGVWANVLGVPYNKQWIMFEPDDIMFLSTLETGVIFDDNHPRLQTGTESYTVWLNIISKNHLYKVDAYTIHKEVVNKNLISVLNDDD